MLTTLLRIRLFCPMTPMATLVVWPLVPSTSQSCTVLSPWMLMPLPAVGMIRRPSTRLLLTLTEPLMVGRSPVP
jgi:hypothetical protein